MTYKIRKKAVFFILIKLWTIKICLNRGTIHSMVVGFWYKDIVKLYSRTNDSRRLGSYDSYNMNPRQHFKIALFQFTCIARSVIRTRISGPAFIVKILLYHYTVYCCVSAVLFSDFAMGLAVNFRLLGLSDPLNTNIKYLNLILDWILFYRTQYWYCCYR